MGVKVHSLNCGTLHPYGGFLIDGNGPLWSPARLSCHCLLIEAGNNLALVDTGLGTADTRSVRRLGLSFNLLCRPQLSNEETAVGHMAKLGFRSEDVTHILLTHLDIDHTGGLPDFSDALVHVLKPEYDGCLHPQRFRERFIYRGLPRVKRWKLHEPRGENWRGFPNVQAVEGLPPEILIVPLPGHTIGHCGVAVQSPSGWILHCGDAFFNRAEIRRTEKVPRGIGLYRNLIQTDGSLRRETLERLRRLAESDPSVRIICSHDSVLYEDAVTSSRIQRLEERP